MMTRPTAIRSLLSALCALTLILAAGVGVTGSFDLNPAAHAQSTGSSVRPPNAASGPGDGGDMPVVIQPQPSDSDSWRKIRRGIEGSVSIMDKKAAVMVQSEGETWRNFNNGPLKNWGGWWLLAVVVVLLLFFLLRGRIRIETGSAGTTIERFNSIERFAHWLTATCFIVLALTGLNITYGRYFLKDLIGPDAFSWLAMIGKVLHNYLAFGFIIGVVLMLVLWLKDNFPNRYDFVWLAKGGGMFGKGVHPPAKKFNAGQKFVFWAVIIGGLVISVSGLYLMFPFVMTDIYGMQQAQLIHAIVALVLVAIVLAHIYIGTLGMEGAFDAMGTGHVDANWAKEHHSVWYDQVKGSGAAAE